MPNLLRNVRVDVVSLVDRAAVRDPQQKSEPRRFVLTKREGGDSPSSYSLRKDDPMSTLTKAQQDAAEEIRQKAEESGIDLAKLGGSTPNRDERFPGDHGVAGQTERFPGDRRPRVALSGLLEEEDAEDDGNKGKGKGSGLTDSGAERTKAQGSEIAKAEDRLSGVMLDLAKAERDGDRFKAESLRRESSALQKALYAERRHDPSRLDYADRGVSARQGRT